MTEILEQLQSLNAKIDDLSHRGSIPPQIQPPQPAPAPVLVSLPPPQPQTPGYGSIHAGMLSHQTSFIGAGDGREVLPPLAALRPQPGPPSPPGSQPATYVYTSSIHKMLAWPVVQQLLESFIPKPSSHAPQGGPANLEFPLRLNDQPLPNYGLESLNSSRPSMGIHQLQVSGSLHELPLSPTSLNWETLKRLSKNFFDTFNLMFPIIDRDAFNNNILPDIVSEGLEDSMKGTLACLVFALGDVAYSGSQGIPLGAYAGRPSGVKGGSVDKPPGLAFFNEARKRMGFSFADCTLESVQMFALAG